MSNKVLIVGAGAMGLTLGYKLHLAGAKITFLERPSGTAHLSRPQILYSYDDAKLKTFSEFEVTTSPHSAKVLNPDYIIVTLDGSTAISTEGAALLSAIGNAVRGTETVIIGSGVGIGVREHYLKVTGLPLNRVIMCTLGCFAHQVSRANLPVIPPTDPALISKADIAYRYYSKSGFYLENHFPEVSKGFAELYNADGSARCTLLEPHFYRIMMIIPFVILACSELLGWIPVTELPKHKELWKISTSAMLEIARLSRHGWRGKITALLMNDKLVAWMWGSIEKNSLPLDFQAFNAFHHGGKVAQQDDEIRRACVAAGEREGKPMTALKELLERLSIARAK